MTTTCPTTIPVPLFAEFTRQVGAEFLEELERAVLADELTEEDGQLLAATLKMKREAA